ncbi:MAG: pseudouridine synthase [Bacteroidia bacterium]|nr:pseudouridine synthase [Bacteroidia bacterium]
MSNPDKKPKKAPFWEGVASQRGGRKPARPGKPKAPKGPPSGRDGGRPPRPERNAEGSGGGYSPRVRPERPGSGPPRDPRDRGAGQEGPRRPIRFSDIEAEEERRSRPERDRDAGGADARPPRRPRHEEGPGTFARKRTPDAREPREGGFPSRPRSGDARGPQRPAARRFADDRREDDRGPRRPAAPGERRFPAARREDDSRGPRRPAEPGERRFPAARREDDRGPRRPDQGDRPYRRSWEDGDRPRRPWKQAEERVNHKMPPRHLPVRLNRYIAQSGVCSRREADELISKGKILVNGVPVTELGAKIVPANDRVEYDGKTLEAKRFVYILLNKPKNMITTTDDPMGRRIVLEAIEKATNERVFPVGRLDRNTTGLLLLTNDGELAERLTHPAHRVRKIYSVRLDRPITPEDMSKLIEGVPLDDGPAQVDKIGYVDGQDERHVGVEIHLGRNRIVRRMFEHLGYQVEALDRTMIAHLTKKNLPRGHWRELTRQEVEFLRMV